MKRIMTRRDGAGGFLTIIWTGQRRMERARSRRTARTIRAAAMPAAALLTMAFASATPCLADLRFCNKSDAKMHVALGYLKRQEGWMSQGWWKLEPGECRTIVHGLPSRIYYSYALDERGHTWSAESDQRGGWFCISPEKFAFRNRDYEDSAQTLHCERDTLKAKQFRMVDTGNSSNYTHNFLVRSEPPEQVPRPSAAPPPQPAPPSPSPPAGATSPATACQRFPSLC